MVRIKNFIKRIWKKIMDIIKYPYIRWKEHKEIKKRIEEIRKKDPFIYK